MAVTRRAGLPLIAAFAAWAAALSAAPEPPLDVPALMTRVSDRLVEYYRRAQNVMCIEVSTVHPIQRDWSPAGFSRTVESELHVDSPAAIGDLLAEPHVVREIRRVNGREPRERDRKARSGCTDPNPLSPEPLAFLLPAHRDDYRFTSVHDATEHGRAAFTVDFTSVVGKSKPVLITDPGGHDDCFDWTGPVATTGRVWIDADTYDVLRVERHVPGPTSIQVPRKLQRDYGFSDWIVLDRDDLTLHYEPVRFQNPDEVILLPSSIESVTILRSDLQSVRRTDKYSDYQRFLTSGRVIRGR
jgi:hypothetical protein